MACRLKGLQVKVERQKAIIVNRVRTNKVLNQGNGS